MKLKTNSVILAKYWLWLPDDGFLVTETCWSSFLILKCFDNSAFFNIVCITWEIKCWINYVLCVRQTCS